MQAFVHNRFDSVLRCLKGGNGSSRRPRYRIPQFDAANRTRLPRNCLPFRTVWIPDTLSGMKAKTTSGVQNKFGYIPGPSKGCPVWKPRGVVWGSPARTPRQEGPGSLHSLDSPSPHPPFATRVRGSFCRSMSTSSPSVGSF